MAAIAVPVLICITLLIDIPPFVWHLKHTNLAAATLVFWVLVCNFFDGINALIWPTADMAHWWHGYVLCDIEVKLVGAWEAGIPGALLCIMRNLSLVLDTENSVLIPTQAMRRRQLAFDFIFSIGIPIYMICIHYVVQPLRYYIYQIAGCVASWDASWPAVVLMGMWPLILCLGAMYYGGEMGPAPVMLLVLTSLSTCHRTNAQIRAKFCIDPQLVEFEPDEISV